jgi:hypothetical protein
MVVTALDTERSAVEVSALHHQDEEGRSDTRPPDE